VLFICGNGLILGALISAVEPVKGLGYVVTSLAPHGVIEIPMLLLATSLGFTVGWESLKWLTGRKNLVRSQLSHSLKLYLRWVLPGLAVAAVIEVFITPWIVGLVGNG
jgi:stage II sporulation protein M